jgi:hypothetical protein
MSVQCALIPEAYFSGKCVSPASEPQSMMVAYVHLEKELEFQKRYSARIIVNLKRILKLFCITDFFGALISMEQGVPRID